MSLEDFYNNVRLGQRLLDRPRVWTDSPQLSPGALAATIEQADLWLAPRIVKGYSREETDFLPGEDRDTLDKAVNGFLGIARAVPADGPATPEQSAAARSHLKAILDILDPQRFSDSREWVAAKLLDRFRASHAGGESDTLADLRYRFETDFDDERLLAVYLIFRDDVVESEQFYSTARQWEDKIAKFLFRSGAEITPSFRVRSESEQAGMRDLDNP